MKIEDLFDVEYGQRIYGTKQSLEGEYGNTPLISSKGEDSGIFDFYNIEPFYNKPFITIPRVGTIGVAFVQDKPCCVDDNCLVLLPKKEMTTEELYQIAYQLRCNIWKYKYGRQITPTRIKKQEIILCEIKKKYKDYKENRQYTQIKESKDKEIPNAKLMKLSDICNIEKKNALPQNAINLDGGIPYITTTSKNNGVSNFTDEEFNCKGNCLTVAMNGSVCEVFYQNKDFITSGDNAVLYLKDEYQNLSEKQKYALLLYIGSVFKLMNKWKYNYCRKLGKTRLENTKLPIPMVNNTIDIQYIESLYNDIFC